MWWCVTSHTVTLAMRRHGKWNFKFAAKWENIARSCFKTDEVNNYINKKVWKFSVVYGSTSLISTPMRQIMWVLRLVRAKCWYSCLKEKKIKHFLINPQKGTYSKELKSAWQKDHLHFFTHYKTTHDSQKQKQMRKSLIGDKESMMRIFNGTLLKHKKIDFCYLRHNGWPMCSVS